MSVYQSDNINELAAALAKAQAAIQPAVKDKTNPAFRSRYADLSAVWDACRKPLTDNGLSIVQMPIDAGEGRIGMSTMLLHTSGQFIRSDVSTRILKDDPQGVGGGLTYLRRYALSAVVGVVADEDDDGNAASQAPQQQQTQRAATNGHTNGNGADRTAGGASVKQIGLIRGLMHKGGWEVADTLEWAGLTVASLEELNGRQASDLIEKLQNAAKQPAE